MHRILVTGAASWLGGNLVRRLESRSDAEVFPVDELDPSVPFGSRFRRSSLDTIEFAEHVLEIDPTAVVHLQTLDGSASEHSGIEVILGSQALFGAVARLTTVRTVIVRSDAAVYGSGPRNPSILEEATTTPASPTHYEQNLREVEAAVGRLAAELPEVTFTVLRFASVIGPTIDNPLSRYLLLPVVPTLLGSDPRLQFVYERDAVLAIEHAIDRPQAGTFNVCGPGQLYLSGILRLGRRLNQPLPLRQFGQAMRALKPVGASLPEHAVNLIRYGRVLDTDRMDNVLGFAPQLNCRRAVLGTYGRLPEEAG